MKRIEAKWNIIYIAVVGKVPKLETLHSEKVRTALTFRLLQMEKMVLMKG